jgi:predicted transcriptional regulator
MGRQEYRQEKGEPPGIGRGELEVLRYVQEHHPVTVRQVAEHLAETRGVVRTTVINVMSRLVAKGFVVRKQADGVFIYSPQVGKETLLRGLVRDFVRGALGGSVSPFVAYLTSEAQLSVEELAELKAVVKELEERSRKGRR